MLPLQLLLLRDDFLEPRFQPAAASGGVQNLFAARLIAFHVLQIIFLVTRLLAVALSLSGIVLSLVLTCKRRVLFLVAE
ncbi:hypothetical protein D3C84_1011760 [compost metagenome]